MTPPSGHNGTAPDIGPYLAALGARVRLLRLAARLTQAQLADAAGMSRSFLSLLEHGAHGADIALLFRLAHALGLPLTELLPNDDHQAAPAIAVRAFAGMTRSDRRPLAARPATESPSRQ